MSKKFSLLHFVISIFAVIVIFSGATRAHAATGFLGGPMWISPEVPTDGQLVYLSALFHNAEPNTLNGEVMFYDGNILLGRKAIEIDSGGVATATVSFRIGAGDHSFSASIGNLTETISTGKSEPFALSPQTVQLPKIFVSSKAGDSLNASVVTDTSNGGILNTVSATNPMAPVVKQVNQLQTDVVSNIPLSVKNPLTDLDACRTKNADALNQQTKSTSDLVKQQNMLAAAQQKKYGKISPTTNFIDRPFAYVKLFFLTLLSFLYSHAIVFYLVGALLVYIIGRFILRKINIMRANNAPAPKRTKSSKGKPKRVKLEE